MEEKVSQAEQKVRDLDFAVNQERATFARFFKKFRVYNLILLIIVLAVITLSVVLLFPLGQTGMGLALVIIIAILIAVIVYSKLMKRYTNNRGKQYMAYYYQTVSDYVFADLNIDNYQQDIEKLFGFEAFDNARMIKDITNAGSRNLVEYRYKKFDIQVADYAAYQQVNKQNKIVFVGKLMSITGIKPIKGRLLVYRRPSAQAIKEATGPNDVEGLELVIEDSDLLVYAEHPENKKYLSKKALDFLRQFPHDLPLVDMTLSFIDAKLVIAISYNDDLMVIPLPEPFKTEPTRTFKTHIQAIHQFLDLI